MNKVFKALADPTRRQILKLLSAEDMSAGDIATHFEIAKPTLSGHLSVLKEADLVDFERQGNVLLYRLKLSVLEEAMIPFMAFFQSGAQSEIQLKNVPENKPAKKRK